MSKPKLKHWVYAPKAWFPNGDDHDLPDRISAKGCVRAGFISADFSVLPTRLDEHLEVVVGSTHFLAKTIRVTDFMEKTYGQKALMEGIVLCEYTSGTSSEKALLKPGLKGLLLP